MSENEVRSVLGDNLAIKTYKEEMKAFWYHNRTIRIDSMTQFILGFEKCLTLSDSLMNSWPVFKVYLNNNKVNLIIITSYLDDSLLAKNVVINKNIRFNDNKEKCLAFFGDRYINTPYPGYDEYVFYTKGIQLIFKDDCLKTFKLFKPDPEFLKRIAARASLIKAEFKAIDKEKGGTDWPD
jgi:hypothetical protein